MYNVNHRCAYIGYCTAASNEAVRTKCTIIMFALIMSLYYYYESLMCHMPREKARHCGLELRICLLLVFFIPCLHVMCRASAEKHNFCCSLDLMY